MRIARRLLHVLVIVLTLVIGATAAAVIVSQTAWFKDRLRGYIERQANEYLNGRLSIQRLGGNLFFGVEMENIGVSMDGSQVVAVKDLGLDYNVFEMIAKGLSIDNIRLNQPVLYLRRDGDTWSISRLVKKQEEEADRSGPAKPIAIDDIGVSDGAVVIEGAVGTSGIDVPKRIDHLDAKLSFKYEPVRYSIDISHVSFRGSDPAIALNALSGGVAVRDDTVFVDKLSMRTAESSVSVDGAVQQYLTKPVFQIQLTSDKLSIPEIARVVPALRGVALQPAFELKVDGPMDRLGVDLQVRSSAGQASARLVADVLTPRQSVNGTMSIRHLNLAPILDDPKQKSDITADAQVNAGGAAFSDLESIRGTLLLNAPRVTAAGYTAERITAKANIDGRRVGVDARAAAYGATATAAGDLVLPDSSSAKAAPLAFDVHGQARGIDLRRMPSTLKVPPAATEVNADYHLAGSAPIGSASDRPPIDVQGDARFLPSTVAGARIADGSTAAFSMRGENVSYSADATVTGLDLQRVGEEFRVPALAADRYASSIDVQLSASGSGTALPEMDVTAHGSLTNTSILGGRIPQLAFDANVAHDTAHVKAAGSFAEFDPAVASGKPAAKGHVAGAVDLEATVNGVSQGVTVDSVQASARVNLEPSTIGGLDIAHARVDGDYHDATGDIRTLEIVGRDVNVKASGTLALNDTGQSNLELHADSPSLDRIGEIVGQPLTGIGKVDAKITGNRRELQAAGNLTGDGVKYGENGALTISSDFTAAVANLDAASARVSASTHATFVSVGGQNINELDAKTGYENKQITFNATARQPKRSLQAAGRVLMHPDHQEIHLEALALQSQGVSWTMAPGANAAIQYGQNAISVDDLRLVNGDQQISAAGTFGAPGDALKVSLANIDLATVDALMLRPPQLSGRLDATSTIAGTKAAPSVDAEFRVNQGGFRQFHYDTLGGTVGYSAAGITLDTRLQQNPTTWMAAKGYVPTALFTSAPSGSEPADAAALPGNADRIDLKVDSSPIDLGLVQGFTTALTDVKGTLEAHVQVGGTASDPRPDGTVSLQDGAFKVEQTGVAYTNLQGVVQLQPDRVHIDNLYVLDNHESALSLSGDLGVQQKRLGDVQLYVTASDFKVIDNKMGNVRINSNMEVGGSLKAPRIAGYLGISTGEVNLDPIIALTGDSAYATKPTEFASSAIDQKGQTAPPSAFDALTMDLHLTVPDDLVVKAADLQTPGSPISLGQVNLTLGGDVRATKEPGTPIHLVGEVSTIRGFYDFQGRRFTILRDGTIRFEGLDELNPTLDIRADRVIKAVTAHVNVRGTLKEPQIVLSSTPPLEQADVLSLIVFNQQLNQLGEGQQISLAQRAESLAAGAAAGALANSIGNALNLDEFEINTAPESGGAAQLTVGEQVGQNLYVKVQQGIGSQSQTNVILEYELTNWLRLQTNVLQGSNVQQQLFQRMQGSGVDLLFFFSY